MMKRSIFLLLMLIAVSVNAAVRTITDVRAVAQDDFGDNNIESFILPLCSIKAGTSAEDSLLQDAISQDVVSLLASGLFSSARADLELDNDKNFKVVFVVTRRFRLSTNPTFVGLNGVIRLSKAADVCKLNEGDAIDDALATVAATRVADELKSRDYPNATVDFKLSAKDKTSGYAELSFIVNLGEERAIRNYTFSGNSSFDSDTLARTIGWLPFWDVRGWFRDFPKLPKQLDDARAMLRDFYLENGFLDAEISPAEFKFVENRENKADIHFKIEEGEVYKIGLITILGAGKFSPDDIRSRVEAAIEREGGRIAKTSILRLAAENVSGYYGDRGFVDTKVQMQMTGREDEPVMDLTFTISEGVPATIRSIQIAGNSKTMDKVIRREIRIQPGELYNAAKIRSAETRLRNLNYFEDPNGVSSYTLKTDAPTTRDLVFELHDAKKTAQYGIGIGASSIDSVFGYASASESNFDLFGGLSGGSWRGGGERASIGVELGSRKQTVDASWTQPWLFDRPISFTVNAYRRLRWYDHYDELRTGLALTWAWNATAFGYDIGRVGVRYTIEQVSYEDPETEPYSFTNSDEGEFSFAEQEDGMNSKLRFFWNRNTRNRPFLTTQGSDILLYVEAGLGGAAKTYGFGVDYRKWYNPYKDHVLMTRFLFETKEAYGDEVPLFDRYFLGGARTVRGFEYRDMGPKVYRDGDDHAAIGGQTRFCGTVEYTIPLANAFRFAVFSDFGTVGEDMFDISGEFGMSVGAGLRLDLPGFPIRLDVAKPIINKDDTNEETFLFWIGLED